MTTVYLHIGMPKTGTTSIQEFLYANRKNIKKQGYVFFDLKIKFKKARKARNAHFLIFEGEYFETLYQKAVEKIKNYSKKFDNIILTDETCYKKNFNIPRFVKDMNNLGICVKIVIYLRRQDLFLQSMWAHRVKEGSTKTFEEYQKTHSYELNYYKQCCMFSDLVGKENLIIHIYERQQFRGKNNDLLTDFLEAVGLKYDNTFVGTETLVNESINGIYLEIRRMLNKYPEFQGYQNFINRSLIEVNKERGGYASYSENRWFTYEEQMKLLSKYAKSNEKVAREFLKREDGILFRDEIIDNKYGEEKYKIEEYVDICAQVMIKREKIIEELQQEKEKQKNKSFLKKLRKKLKFK